jgi:hypothetical protein
MLAIGSTNNEFRCSMNSLLRQPLPHTYSDNEANEKSISEPLS